MNLLFNIQQTVTFLILLSVLVVAHEWGHFIVARIFKIRVDDFSIGFGKRLVRLFKLGDTEYNIRMFPLGGFVKIAGMDADEEPIIRAKEAIDKRAKVDPDSKEIPLIAENTGEADPYDDVDGFNAKPLWQRSLVILAGPVMSFITGFVIFCLVGWVFGLPTGKWINRVAMVEPGGEAQRIGLRTGDYITSIDGHPITTGTQMVLGIQNSLNKPIQITVQRGDYEFHRTVTPKELVDEDNGKPLLVYEVTNPGALAAIGLQAGDRLAQFNNKDIGDLKSSDISPFFKQLAASAGKKAELIVMRNALDAKTLKGVIPPAIASAAPVVSAHPIGVLHIEPDAAIVRLSLSKSIAQGCDMTKELFIRLYELIKVHKLTKAVGGPIMVFSQTGIAIKDGPGTVCGLAGQISISLAIFNLFPIPVLDGGHLLAFFIEKLRRGRKMTPQLQQAFLMTGLAIIGLLFVLIMGHDLWNNITGHVPQ